jgi:Flp pilus assembly protein TadG
MRVRRKANRSKGVSAVEMALVAPFIVALMMGQIESARLGMVSQLLSTAAREGCRVAVIPGHTQDDVQSRVNSILSGSGISVGTVKPTCDSPYTWTTAPKGTGITLALSVRYRDVTWLGTPYFLSDAIVSASVTMSSENP